MVESRIENDDRELRKEMTAKDAMRNEPAAAERTTRAGAAFGTERAGIVMPPVITTRTPLRSSETVTETAVRHARDESVHPDWERQSQINAPQDVGVPTPEGQADAARIREGRRRSDEAEEPRLERRGDEVSTPMASRANIGTMTQKRDFDKDADRRI
jgi:hypothetical protein